MLYYYFNILRKHRERSQNKLVNPHATPRQLRQLFLNHRACYFHTNSPNYFVSNSGLNTMYSKLSFYIPAIFQKLRILFIFLLFGYPPCAHSTRFKKKTKRNETERKRKRGGLLIHRRAQKKSHCQAPHFSPLVAFLTFVCGELC